MENQVYHSIRQKRMFFITGRGRSGTWLLQSILSKHPDICVAPEALFIIHLQRKYAHVKQWTDKVKSTFLKDLLTEEKIFSWWKAKKEDLKKILDSYPEETDFFTVCKGIYYDYACRNDKSGALLLGDKNPEYSRHIASLLKLHPNAKFIHLVRDPRANVLSYQKVDFDLNNTAALAYRWQLYNKDVLPLQKQFPKKILIIKYEDLLTDTSGTLQNICSFLSINFSEQLTDFKGTSQNIFSWNTNITAPIQAKKADDWKGKISPKEEAAIFHICGALAERFAYQTSLKARISATHYPGVWMGKLTGILEILLFRLPIGLRMFILNAYRKQVRVLE